MFTECAYGGQRLANVGYLPQFLISLGFHWDMFSVNLELGLSKWDSSPTSYEEHFFFFFMWILGV